MINVLAAFLMWHNNAPYWWWVIYGIVLYYITILPLIKRKK